MPRFYTLPEFLIPTVKFERFLAAMKRLDPPEKTRELLLIGAVITFRAGLGVSMCHEIHTPNPP